MGKRLHKKEFLRFKKNLGRRIKAARNKAQMSQWDVATVLGIAQNQVCFWERGRWAPDGWSLCLLANTLNVSVDWLVGRADMVFPDPPEIKEERVQIKAEEEIIIQTPPQVEQPIRIPGFAGREGGRLDVTG